jgi:Protein of unknown function (DUF1214)
MAYGESPVDAELRDAWQRFCDRLKTAGDLVFKDVNPANARQRVDGFRYLTQNLSQAFDLALETRDTRFPALHAFCSPTRKLGSDNADCIYLQAWIDGESVYRISGKKGTARMSNVAVQGPRSAIAYGTAASRPLHEPFGDTPEANLFGHDLAANWDGSFELYVGGERQGPNWLPTTKGTRKLFLRQYFDRWDEEAAEYRIERVGMAEPRPVPTVAQMTDAMRWAGDFVYDVVDYWPEWVWEAGDQIDPGAINRFAGRNVAKDKPWSAEAEAMDARRGRLITMMRWALRADEALILEFDAYDGFWMITSEAIFGNSMDYLYRPVSYTPSRTAVDPDGVIRLVLSRGDSGFSNWIDNQGYTSGVLTFRNVHSRHVPELRTKVVPAVDVARHLSPDSRRSTAEERVAELRARFDAIRRRYRI